MRLVVAHDVDRLGAAEHGAEALDRRPDDVVERLLRGERGSGVPREEAQPTGARVLRPEAARRDPVPEAPRRAELRDFLEQVEGRREVERQPGRERVERHAPVDELRAVGDGRRHREPELLDGVAARLASVVPGHRDRIEPGEVLRGERDHVPDEPHRGIRRVHERLAGQELLQDVVLERPGQVPQRDALPLGSDDVRREDDGRGRVDREVDRHALERDPAEHLLHVLCGVDRNAYPAHP